MPLVSERDHLVVPHLRGHPCAVQEQDGAAGAADGASRAISHRTIALGPARILG